MKSRKSRYRLHQRLKMLKETPEENYSRLASTWLKSWRTEILKRTSSLGAAAAWAYLKEPQVAEVVKVLDPDGDLVVMETLNRIVVEAIAKASDKHLGKLAAHASEGVPPKGVVRGRYRSSLCPVLVEESRVVAGLLLAGVDEATWKDAIEKKNVLQAKSGKAAMRVAGLIRNRLETMQSDLWRLVRDGDATVAPHAVLAAAVKHSPLLGDFLLVVRKATVLSKATWEEYLAGCRQRDGAMPLWEEPTKNRLRSVVFGVLRDVGFVDGEMRVQAVEIAAEVERYLRAMNERYVMKCMGVAISR